MTQHKSPRFWTSWRLSLTLIVLLVGTLIGLLSCNSSNRPATPPTSPTTTTNPRSRVPTGLSTLPPNVLQAELPTASGAPIKLGDYSGKVLFVNLWATWCGPCRVETPELVKLNKEFQARGVEMFGLSTENPEESAEKVREFIEDYRVTYHVGWATPEVAATLMQGRGSIPQSFIISRQGRIVRRFIGYNPEATPPQLRQALEDALAEKG
jgi:peroxiredoxin